MGSDRFELGVESILLFDEFHGGDSHKGFSADEVAVAGLFLFEVVDQGEEAVVFGLGDRIDFVIVASGALHRKAEEYRRDGVDTIGHILDAVLFLDDASFGVVPLVSEKSGGDLLLQVGLWEQIPCELFGEESIVGHVVAEGLDNPIAPGPHLAIFVIVVAIGIGIAS